jgi:hypothetical protein
LFELVKTTGTTVLFGRLLGRVDNARPLRSWWQVVADGYKALALLVLNAVVLYAGFELVAAAGFKIQSLVARPREELVGEGKPREKVSYYASQNWAKRYWYEHRLSGRMRYYPYVGWRRAPFKGQTITIDQDGIRSTPGADCSAGSFKVFAFGESSMWGTGAPDWGTIPAYLQKRLEQIRRGPVCVMNFAESAYVSTQDVIMLLLQLRSGNIPDLVLFYGIEGDIAAGYQSGRAGVPANLDDIGARFEGRRPPPTVADLLRATYAYSLIGQLVGKLTITPRQAAQLPSNGPPHRSIDLATLGDRIAQDYLGTYRVVDALAQRYGFKYVFFLQPSLILGNKPLTPEEQGMKREVDSDPRLESLVKSVYRVIEGESRRYRNIHSLIHVFDDCDDLLWIDAGHVTPVGNELVAQRMLEVAHAASLAKQ